MGCSQMMPWEIDNFISKEDAVRRVMEGCRLENHQILVLGMSVGCPSCEIYKKQLDAGQVNYEYVAVDQHPELAEEYKVLSTPTTVILRNGHMVGKRSGAMSVKKLDEFIKDCT